MLNPHVFRAYDVRGLVGPDINPDVFRQVGRAYATLVRRNSGRRIAVGQANRLSSNGLKAGFVDGVRAAGVGVIDIGLVTTPILYFATAHWKLDGGANITGSHNPIEYNGVKMVHPGAVPLSEEEIQALRTMAEGGDYESGAGEVTQPSPRADYFEPIAGTIRPARPLRAAVDAGNGVPAPRASSTSSPRRPSSMTSGRPAACPSGGRPATRTSSARCARTTSCSAAR